jgi:hypothetical protein
MKEIKVFFLFLAIDETSEMFNCYEHFRASGEFTLQAKDYGPNLFIL